MNTITIEGLTIGYKNKPVEANLTATVAAGQLTCLLGSNGRGKSTLLRTIAGLQPALAGNVLLAADGFAPRAVSTIGRSEMARWVSVVLTEQPDVRLITVGEMVGMGRMPYTGFFGSLGPRDREIIARSLRALGMEAFAPRLFETLSDGERQKVMIARALAQETPIVLLDEPTAFLDYPSKVEVMKTLQHLAATMGKTIMLSTHDLELASLYAHRLLALDHGLHEVTKAELRGYIEGLR